MALQPRGSFSFVFETFDDLLSNNESNRIAGEFVTRKMLEKVKDPQVRDMLTPRGYPFFAKRPPLDHGYHETFNRDNVRLVDIGEQEPLVEITATGIRTTKQHYEFDIIVLAIGFQAYTGAQRDKVHSWMMGANLNNRAPRVLIYYGGANVYYDKLRESAESGFPEVEFQRMAG